jgi:hypothetical protein
MRLPLDLVFIGTSIALTVQGQWGAGGVSLLIGALVLPNYAKRRKIAAKSTGRPLGADRPRRRERGECQ